MCVRLTFARALLGSAQRGVHLREPAVCFGPGIHALAACSTAAASSSRPALISASATWREPTLSRRIASRLLPDVDRGVVLAPRHVDLGLHRQHGGGPPAPLILDVLCLPAHRLLEALLSFGRSAGADQRVAERVQRLAVAGLERERPLQGGNRLSGAACREVQLTERRQRFSVERIRAAAPSRAPRTRLLAPLLDVRPAERLVRRRVVRRERRAQLEQLHGPVVVQVRLGHPGQLAQQLALSGEQDEAIGNGEQIEIGLVDLLRGART